MSRTAEPVPYGRKTVHTPNVKDRCIAHAPEVNPGPHMLCLSAETSEGMRDRYRWLSAGLAQAGAGR